MNFESKQLRVLAIVLAAIVSVLLLAYFWIFQTAMVPAYENIRQSDSSAIAEQLTAAEIPYELANNGHDILVPENRISEARVAVAGSDVAVGGTVGFELFNDSDMGLTEFAQKINFQRAMQGELARTIMMMDGVEFARVHLALPERSVFRSAQGDPTAAVTIQMRANRPLTAQKIGGIRQLVASSVPSMSTGSVAILDDRGDLVSGIAAPLPADGSAITQRAALEEYYRTRARDSIRTVLGNDPFEVTLNTRRLDAQAIINTPDARSTPGRDGLVFNIMVRTPGELPGELSDAVTTVVTDTLELDPSRGDTLSFTIGAVGGRIGAPGANVGSVPSSDRTVAQAGQSELGEWNIWESVSLRWLLVGLVLLALVALAIRPRRQMDDEETASFAELLKTSSADRESADAA